jgi:hypothetical protein
LINSDHICERSINSQDFTDIITLIFDHSDQWLFNFNHTYYSQQDDFLGNSAGFLMIFQKNQGLPAAPLNQSHDIAVSSFTLLIDQACPTSTYHGEDAPDQVWVRGWG